MSTSVNVDEVCVLMVGVLKGVRLIGEYCGDRMGGIIERGSRYCIGIWKQESSDVVEVLDDLEVLDKLELLENDSVIKLNPSEFLLGDGIFLSLKW